MVKIEFVWVNVLRNALTGIAFNAFLFGNCWAQINPAIQFAPIGSLSVDSGITWLQKAFDSSIKNNVQVVGLGEVSHGGWEPMAFKTKMIQYLVQKRGYRNILFELCDLANVMPLRHYLTDNNVRDFAIADSLVDRMNIQPVCKVVFNRLFRWLKQYNMTHADGMVQVKGFDLPPHAVEFYNYFTYNYLIPFDPDGAQKMIYQWSSAPITDSLKVQNMLYWFNANKNRLMAGLDKKEFTWLNYNIQNQLCGLQYSAIKKIDNHLGLGDERLNRYRDSIMALNVRSIAGNEKSIVWAHNAHIYEGSSFMGTYLRSFYQSKYFSLLTDFSIDAKVAVLGMNGSGDSTFIYAKYFESEPTTTAYAVLHNYKAASGVFFHKEISAKQIHDRVNTITAKGENVVIGSSKAFDALVVFDKITTNVK